MNPNFSIRTRALSLYSVVIFLSMISIIDLIYTYFLRYIKVTISMITLLFRAADLDSVMYRMGLLAVLRSKVKNGQYNVITGVI